MCVVSMVGDHYRDKFNLPGWPISIPANPVNPSTGQMVVLNSGVTKAEFDALKAEVEEMKKLLIRAKIYDEQNNEPNCEMEDKVALLKRIAELVGVDLSEVFGCA